MMPQEIKNPTAKERARAQVRWEELPKRKRTGKALAELIADEQTRAFVPNRAALRRAGVMRGRARFRKQRALKMAIINAPALTEDQKDRAAAREIVAADRRRRLLLDVPIAPRPAKLNKYGRVEKG